MLPNRVPFKIESQIHPQVDAVRLVLRRGGHLGTCAQSQHRRSWTG